jgi:hypothetical protein
MKGLEKLGPFKNRKREDAQDRPSGSGSRSQRGILGTRSSVANLAADQQRQRSSGPANTQTRQLPSVPEEQRGLATGAGGDPNQGMIFNSPGAGLHSGELFSIPYLLATILTSISAQPSQPARASQPSQSPQPVQGSEIAQASQTVQARDRAILEAVIAGRNLDRAKRGWEQMWQEVKKYEGEEAVKSQLDLLGCEVPRRKMWRNRRRDECAARRIGVCHGSMFN